MAKYIMLQGTSSNVGKSIVTAAVCRILKQDGYNVAPFKAQNMALNSFVTKSGGEMGRAQVVQAEAAGIEPEVEMNPVLLKPTGNSTSQIIVLGKPVGTMKAKEYHDDYAQKAFAYVKQALAIIDKKYDVLAIEGAGSPAEINLKANDIVNMSIAKYLNAPVLLIADIDRGGSIASLVGTMEILDEEERALVKGFIINKFRGDVSILAPALDYLEEKTGKPVLGVLNYIEQLDIDDEDSVALESKQSESSKEIQIAVIRTPKISNFTDFAALEAEADVSVNYVNKVSDLGKPDLIILPGSKNTTEDLRFVKESGLEKQIINLNKQGVPVIGICGGYQMLGEKLQDPDHTESEIDEMAGLSLLPLVTTFLPEKVTRQVKAKCEGNGFIQLDLTMQELEGYEIHMGSTEYTRPVAKAFILDRGEGAVVEDGAVREDGLVMGTYMHGVFDNDKLRRNILDALREKKGLAALGEGLSMKDRKEAAYNRLADNVRSQLDMTKIYQIMGLDEK